MDSNPRSTSSSSNLYSSTLLCVIDSRIDKAFSEINSQVSYGCTLLASPRAKEFDALFFHETLNELHTLREQLWNKVYTVFKLEEMRQICNNDSKKFYELCNRWNSDVAEAFQPIFDKITARYV